MSILLVWEAPSTHSGIDICSGFPLAAVDEILLYASTQFFVDTLTEEKCMFNSKLYDLIVSMVRDISKEHELVSVTEHEVSSSSSIAEYYSEDNNDSDNDSDSDDDSDKDFIRDSNNTLASDPKYLNEIRLP